MVCPPARRGIRTAAPGSCAEGRFQDRRRLISEARAENHISPRPSCSVCLHYEPQKLIPGARAHGGSAPGVIPAARTVDCAAGWGSRTAAGAFQRSNQAFTKSRARVGSLHTNSAAHVILGLGPKIHRAAYSSTFNRCGAMRSYSTYILLGTPPGVAPSTEARSAGRWILGPSPRMTVECAAGWGSRTAAQAFQCSNQAFTEPHARVWSLQNQQRPTCHPRTWSEDPSRRLLPTFKRCATMRSYCT